MLQAAYDLIAERGLEGATMDAIAAASGVSKATVYKHWSNKDALLLDVIRRLSEKYPEFNSGDARADLTALLRHLAYKAKSQELAKIWPHVISYAMSNPAFGRALQDFAFQPRREMVQRLLEQASVSGGLRDDVDPEFAMDLLIGPIVHRRMIDEKNMPPDFPEQVVGYFWKVFAR